MPACFSLVFSKRVSVRLRKDAPKYEGKILKEPLLIIYNEMYCARRGRSNALRKLSHLLEQRKRIQEVIIELTECNENLRAECNKRKVLPPPPNHHAHAQAHNRNKKGHRSGIQLNRKVN
jgi:hypothetical protein